MKKMAIITFLVFLLHPFILFAESPGSWRGKETFGLGFGVEGIGGGGFFDYAINSTFQLHFFGSSMNQKQESLFRTNSVETNSSIGGLTLRMFPSDSSGFFFGFGGGGFSINQTVNQKVYCNSYFTSLNPPECLGYEGTYLKQQTLSEGSGSAGFGEIGWQGYDGYYFTIGIRAGGVTLSNEVDNTDKVIDYSNHKITAQKQWKDGQTASGGLLSFGWHF